MQPRPDPAGYRHPVHGLLAGLRLAPRQAHGALSLWPLTRGRWQPPPTLAGCRTLPAALSAGDAWLDEVHDDGVVPQVRLVNRSDAPVLVLFGDEMRGARQDRVANATFLVAARSECVLDVSCVEAGRWGRRPGARFESCDELASHGLRRTIQRGVRAERAAGGRFRADQDAVWGEVACRLRTSGARSHTSRYADYVERRAEGLRRMEESFHRVEGQVGFVAAVGDRMVGLEVVGGTGLLAELFPRLLRAHAIDALDAEEASDAPPRGWLARWGPRPVPACPAPDRPAALLVALSRAECTRSPSLGLGDDLRLEAGPVTGCALDAGGIVHLTAFVDPDAAPPGRPG